MPNIELKNIIKTYDNGAVIAVDDLSLKIKSGEYIAILGPSGCGKTTTLKVIAGLTQPDSGIVSIDGKDVTDKPPHLRGIGFVFQHYEIFPNMTILENVMFGPNSLGWSKSRSLESAINALKMVDILNIKNVYPKGLNAPDLQRTGIARAIATGARTLLLDEPLGALDFKIREESQHELRNLVKNLGLTAIHVTHDQKEAMAIADRIMVMKRGELKQIGSPEDLYYSPSSLFVSNFIGEANYIPARVLTIGPPIKLETRYGSIFYAKNNIGKIKRGDRVVIVFRKESPTISTNSFKEINSINGKIENEYYLGNMNKISVKITDGTILEVFKEGRTKDQFEHNQDITIILEEESLLVYPYPRDGLDNALSI
ncbi:MAG: ABC transporter ATP-binding protein [Candidatus Ranarchaeia archaeon]